MGENERYSDSPSHSARNGARGRAIVAMTIVVLSYLAFVGVQVRSSRALPSLCPFRRLTGMPCPLCGLTRAICLLFRGRAREAISRYPVAIVCGILGLTAGVVRLHMIGKES